MNPQVRLHHDILERYRADAEFRAGIDRLLPIGEPGNESGRVIGDTALYQLAELAKVRRKAWDAYIDCVKSSRQ
jgi:hypothetical protein